MKKNSKVMNVLMSLFLVMGMVFGNGMVLAEGEPDTTNTPDTAQSQSEKSVCINWNGAGNDFEFTYPKDVNNNYEISIILEDINSNMKSSNILTDASLKYIDNEDIDNDGIKEIKIPWDDNNKPNFSRFFNGTNPQFDKENVKITVTVNNVSDTYSITTPRPEAYLEWDNDKKEIVVSKNLASDEDVYNTYISAINNTNSNQTSQVAIYYSNETETKYVNAIFKEETTRICLGNVISSTDNISEIQLLVPGYKQLVYRFGNSESENNDYRNQDGNTLAQSGNEPITGCTLSYNSSNQKYEISCDSEEFTGLGNWSSYNLELCAGTAEDPTIPDWPNSKNYNMNYHIEYVDSRKLAFSLQDLGMSQFVPKDSHGPIFGQGVYIPKGDYYVALQINSRGTSKSFSFNQKLSVMNNINKPAPKVKASYGADPKTATGIIIECDYPEGTAGETINACRSYLKYIADNQHKHASQQGKYDQGGNFGGANSGVILVPSDGKGRNYIPDLGGDRKTDYIVYDDRNGKLTILKEELITQSVRRNASHTIYINAPLEYESNKVPTPVNIDYPFNHLEVTKIALTTATYNDKEVPASIDVTVKSNSIDVLRKMTKLKLQSKTEDWRSADMSIFTDRFGPECFKNNGDETYTLSIPMSALNSSFPTLGSNVDLYVTPSFAGYEPKQGDSWTKEIHLGENPYKNWPMETNLEIHTVAEGFLVSVKNGGDEVTDVLRSIAEFPDDYPYATPANATLSGVGTNGHFHIAKNENKFEYLADKKALLIHSTYSGIKNRWEVGSEDSTFSLSIVDPIYPSYEDTKTKESLTPMILFEEATKSGTKTLNRLSELDTHALNDLARLNVIDNIVEEKETADVGITGLLAGVVSSDQNGDAFTDELSYVGSEKKDIKVTTSISKAEGKPKEEIESYIKNNGFSDVNKKFTVDIEKESAVTEGKYVVKDLPYKVALTFDMPNEPAPAGYHYVLLREHTENENTVNEKTTITPLPVEEVDGKGIAYTDQFSTFALAIEKDAPKPAPSKKESSSGSSTPKKDNVVTCQMAGYPANYAWNESVKACQPGYLDNNGVFHLTTGNTNKRVGVVNTSDKGIGGTIAALISSTIAAIAAAYALKKWN